MRRLSMLVALAALAVALVPAPGRAATVTVFMNLNRFCTQMPCLANQDVTINRGDTVEWVYADPLCTAFAALGCYHTVSRTASPAFESGPMPASTSSTNPKLTFSRTFTSTGTFSYFCALHIANGMAARVIVQ